MYTNSTHVLKSGVLDLNISDHQAIFLTRKHIPKNKCKASFTGRSYIDFDEQLFCEHLIDHNWNHLYMLDDVNIAWDYFIDIVFETIDELCPLKILKIKNLKDPWITNEILENIHDKDFLLRRAKRSNNINDWNDA